MKALVGHDKSVAEWVAGKVGKPFEAPYTAIGALAGDGTLRGGFVFTGYNGSSVEMTLAGAGTLDRSMWRAIGSYVFDQLGCARLQVHTAASNRAVRKLAPRLGFTFEGKSRRFYGGEDAYLYSLVADDLPRFKARWRL